MDFYNRFKLTKRSIIENKDIHCKKYPISINIAENKYTFTPDFFLKM